MSVAPYRFVPIYKDRIWGGRNLQRLYGRRLPDGARIGESWELADLEQGESVVADGPDAGKPLNALLKEKAAEILGAARPLANGRFPLLLKLLDANDILSLQVHPDARAARRLGPPAAPKTECWYVIESRCGYIYKGARPGVTADLFRQALQEDPGGGRLRELLQRVNVARDDFHSLPAGTVHALGPGVVVAEVQTPADTTYRVSDWGRGREVHVAQAMACIHFQPSPPSDRRPGNLLVRSAFFSVYHRALAGGRTRKLPVGRCAAWMILAGRGRIDWHGDPGGMTVAAGETILFPAGLAGAVVSADDELACLEITLPSGPARQGNP